MVKVEFSKFGSLLKDMFKIRQNCVYITLWKPIWLHVYTRRTVGANRSIIRAVVYYVIKHEIVEVFQFRASFTKAFSCSQKLLWAICYFKCALKIQLSIWNFISDFKRNLVKMSEKCTFQVVRWLQNGCHKTLRG